MLKEGFDDNSRGWDEIVDDSLQTRVRGGVLEYVRTATVGARYDWKDVAMDWTQDWQIDVRLRILDGTDTHGAGLIWGASGSQNHFGLAVSHDGYFQFYRHKNGELEVLEKWEKSAAIEHKGKWNNVVIRKESDAVSIWINNTWVAGYNYSYYNWYGNKVGVVVNRNLHVVFDHLVVSHQPSKKMRLVAGIDTTKKRQRLPNTVNSKGSDYVDGILPDGATLYISRADHPGNTPPIEKRDLWVSTRDASGSWREAVNMGAPINNAGSNYLVSPHPDGNQLVIQNVYSADGTAGGGGICMSQRDGNVWSLPKTLVIEDNVFLGSTASSYMAPDGQTLVLGGRRADTRGADDLYVSFLQTDGTWSAPLNMGDDLNTSGNDVGPFIAPDNKTLIFSSNGYPGYGGLDLFVSRRLDDTWTKWSEPENLGPTINADEFDAFLQFAASGDSAYFSASTPDMSADIFSIVLPTGARPLNTAIISGRVLNAKTLKPVGAKVIYERLSDGYREGLALANPSTGEYSVVLSGTTAYGVRAEADGFYPLSEQLTLQFQTESRIVARDLFLLPVEQNVAIVLNNVFFDVGKADLRPESFPELNRLAQYLTSQPNAVIEVHGHTDDVGNDKDNLVLSQNRVNSVVNYIVEHGVNKSRVTAKRLRRNETARTKHLR